MKTSNTADPEQRRTALNGLQKTVLFLLCAFDVWALLQNDQITNATAALLFGGQVPGTHVVLSPDSMMSAALGLSLLGALVLCWLGVRRWMRPRAAMRDTANGTHRIMAAVALGQLSEAESPDEIAPAPQPQPKSIVLPKLRTARRGGSRLKHGALVAAYMGVWALSATVAALAMGTQRGAEWIARMATALWRWVSPRLWAFDGWLERHTQQMLARTKKKLRQNEAAAVLLDYLAR